MIVASGISGPSAGIYLRRQGRLQVALLLLTVVKRFSNPLPRGARGPSPERRANIRECVLETIESGLPGFRQALLYERFLSPAEHQSRLGLRRAAIRHVAPR